MDRVKVLIVDDDPIVRDVLSDILSSLEGYRTDVAVDGIEGLKSVQNSDYDIVFTDLNMPRLSGMDFLKEVKKIAPAVPVVVITAFSSMDNAINAMKEGAKDFVSKPFRIDVITSMVTRIIGERNLLRKIGANGDQESSIVRLNAELFKRLQEISILQCISNELDCLYDNRETYERIVEMASRLLLVKEASFGIIENGYLKIKRSIGLPEKDIPVAGTVFEKVLETKKHYLSDFGEVSPFTDTSIASPFFLIPFSINNEVFGILALSNKADGTAFNEEEISLALTFSKKAAQRIENNALYEVFYNNMINTLKSLVTSIEARDPYTKHHSERVTSYALQIADIMNISVDDKDAIRFGGYLHDIGKIGVRDTVLLKPGRLTDEEMSEIRLHPVIGDTIIKPLRFFPRERELILHHHERVDGRGYPDSLEGDKISQPSRILAVADTYDAMTSSRPYRTARTHEEAINELLRCSNTQFDGEIVRAFLKTPAGSGVLYGA